MSMLPFVSVNVRCAVKGIIMVLLFLGTVMAEQQVATGCGADSAAAFRKAIHSAVCLAAAGNMAEDAYQSKKGAIDSALCNAAHEIVTATEVDSAWNTLGIWSVRLDATVSLSKLEEVLVKHKLIDSYIVKPRVVIQVNSTGGGAGASGIVYAAAVNKMVKHGFVVVDSSEIRSDIRPVVGVQDSLLLDRLVQAGIEMVVNASVEVASPKRTDVYGVEFFEVTVQQCVNVVAVPGGRVLTAATKSVTKKARSEAAAMQEALAEVGGMVMEEVLRNLIAQRADPSYSENWTVLTLSGGNEKLVDEFLGFFEHLPMVRSVKVDMIQGDRTIVSVMVRGGIQALRTSITGWPAGVCSIRSMTINAMEVDLGEKRERKEVGLKTDDELKVAVQQFLVEPIFPSRVKYYEEHPTVSLKLAGDCPVVGKCKISIDLPEMGRGSALINTKECSGGGEIVPLQGKLPLDEKKILLNQTEKKVFAKATVACEDNGKKKVFTVAAPVAIYGANAMDWRQPDAIASFVSNGDPEIIGIAAQAVATSSGDYEEDNDFLHAMALFLAMNRLGIRYVKDPLVSRKNAFVDRVQYPVETVKRLGGDCDDLSVLYAALLSSVGIEAAMIVYPEHITVMFNSGIYPKNRHLIGAGENDAVVYNGTLWIPVEVTLLEKGFNAAWHAAADDFQVALKDTLATAIVELSKAWSVYPPPEFQGMHQHVKVGDMNGALDGEVAMLEKGALTSIQKRIECLEADYAHATDDSVKSIVCNKKGVALVRMGDYDGALKQFEESLILKKSESAENNRANTLLLLGENDSAAAVFDALLRKTKQAGIAVNRALAEFVGRKDNGGNKFVSLMNSAAALLKKGESLDALLGVSVSAGEKEKGARQEVRTEGAVNVARLKMLVKFKVHTASDRKVAGTTSEASTGNRLSGTSSETSTGALADDEKQLAATENGLKGADSRPVARLRDLLYWEE